MLQPQKMIQPATWGKLPRIFWFLLVGVFINRLGSFLYLLSYYLSERHHFSEGYVGIAVVLYGAGAILSGPLGGWLADRLGRRSSMMVSMVLGAGGMMQLAFAQGRWYILFATFALGLLGDLYRPAMNAAIADIVLPAERPRAYGWAYWTANLGFAMSALLGGTLVQVGYTTLFAVDAITTLGFAILVFFLVPETQVLEKASFAEGLVTQNVKGPYTDSVFVSFLAVQFLLEFLLQQSIASLGLDMKNHNVSAQHFAYLNGVNAGLIVLLQPVLRRMVRHIRRAWVLAGGACLLGMGLGLFVFAVKDLRLAILATGLWTVGELLMFSMVPSVIYDLSPAQTRGRYQGAYQLVVSLALVTGPLYGAFCLRYIGSQTLWLSCLAIGLVAAILHVLIAPARHQRLVQMYGLYETQQREDGIHEKK